MICRYLPFLVPPSFQNLQLLYNGAKEAVTTRITALSPFEKIQFITDQAKTLKNRATLSLSNIYKQFQERVQIEAKAFSECKLPIEKTPEPVAAVKEAAVNKKTKLLIFVLLPIVVLLSFLMFVFVGIHPAIDLIKNHLDPHIDLIESISQ